MVNLAINNRDAGSTGVSPFLLNARLLYGICVGSIRRLRTEQGDSPILRVDGIIR
jgi:hypothetical protein